LYQGTDFIGAASLTKRAAFRPLRFVFDNFSPQSGHALAHAARRYTIICNASNSHP